jgi:hypothetical protein
MDELRAFSLCKFIVGRLQTIKKFKKTFTIFPLLFWLLIPHFAQAKFTFFVTSDQRQYAGPSYNSKNHFRGVVEAVRNQGGGVFMVSPGDIDPPQDSKWTIEQVLGTAFLWYPVVGNHELPGAGNEVSYGANMQWLRDYDLDANGVGNPPDIVNAGPSGCVETTYSFDYENAHFVVLNEYCDADGDDVTDGDIPNHLYNWLVADLAATTKEHIFIFGHEPAYPQPDADNGRARHMNDSLNKYQTNRDKFWNLLKTVGVVAYFCAHTHNYSAIQLDGVWQLDSGHARGKGDTGAPGTFLLVHVNGSMVTFKAYRDNHDGNYDYADIVYSGELHGSLGTTVSFQDGVLPDTAYSGTRDTTLSQNDPNSNFGSKTALYVDGDDPGGSGKDKSALVYWDINDIPIGMTVNEASITLSIFNRSNDTYQMFEIIRNWVESESTWNRYRVGLNWQIPGAFGSQDRGATSIGFFSPNGTGTYSIKLNGAGLALVQSWVDNPTDNHGIIIANGNATDGADFYSSEVITANNRPKLTISYMNNNLLHILVQPCRIVDTRLAGGAITPGGIRSYIVYGAVTSQGGNLSGCPSPQGEPLAVALNVTVVPLGNGNIVAYPFGSPVPTSSLVNYRADAQNVANSGTVKTCFNCTKDISVKSRVGTVHVVIDVLGYYHAKP